MERLQRAVREEVIALETSAARGHAEGVAGWRREETDRVGRRVNGVQGDFDVSVDVPSRTLKAMNTAFGFTESHVAPEGYRGVRSHWTMDIYSLELTLL